MSDKIFSGSMVIHYENCSIATNGTRYVEATTTVTDSITINLPHVHNLTAIPTPEELNLQDLHLKNLENDLSLSRLTDQATTHLTAVYVRWNLNLGHNLHLDPQENSITFTPTPLDTVVTPAIPSFAMPSLWPSFQTTRALLHFPIVFLTLTFLSLLTRQFATSALFRFSIVSPEPLIAKPRAGVGHSFCSLHLGAFALSQRGEEALRSAVLGNRKPAHATLR
ncbi:hypothetical protein ACLKA6_013876 [Drosophila palustris]